MTIDVLLRPVIDSDLDEFFAHRQSRGEASPSDYIAFVARWHEQLTDQSVRIRTLTVAEQVVGYIAHFTRKGLPEVSYELGPQFWGNGFATAALRYFVDDLDVRPLYARAAKDNTRSIRVLQKNGFSAVGKDKFVTSDGREIEEVIFSLGAT